MKSHLPGEARWLFILPLQQSSFTPADCDQNAIFPAKIEYRPKITRMPPDT